MAALVQVEEVRDRLLKAEQQSSTGDIKDALRETAIAFQELLYGFEWEIMKQNS